MYQLGKGRSHEKDGILFTFTEIMLNNQARKPIKILQSTRSVKVLSWVFQRKDIDQKLITCAKRKNTRLPIAVRVCAQTLCYLRNITSNRSKFSMRFPRDRKYCFNKKFLCIFLLANRFCLPIMNRLIVAR